MESVTYLGVQGNLHRVLSSSGLALAVYCLVLSSQKSTFQTLLSGAYIITLAPSIGA